MSSPVAIKSLPHWVVESLKGLVVLSQLPPDWDSYGARPVSPEVLGLCMRLLGLLEEEDLPVPHLSAGSGGSVDFEWRVGGRALQIEIIDSQTAEYLIEEPDGRMKEGRISPGAPGDIHDLIRCLFSGE